MQTIDTSSHATILNPSEILFGSKSRQSQSCKKHVKICYITITFSKQLVWSCTYNLKDVLTFLVVVIGLRAEYFRRRTHTSNKNLTINTKSIH